MVVDRFNNLPIDNRAYQSFITKLREVFDKVARVNDDYSTPYDTFDKLLSDTNVFIHTPIRRYTWPTEGFTILRARQLNHYWSLAARDLLFLTTNNISLKDRYLFIKETLFFDEKSSALGDAMLAHSYGESGLRPYAYRGDFVKINSDEEMPYKKIVLPDRFYFFKDDWFRRVSADNSRLRNSIGIIQWTDFRALYMIKYLLKKGFTFKSQLLYMADELKSGHFITTVNDDVISMLTLLQKKYILAFEGEKKIQERLAKFNKEVLRLM